METCRACLRETLFDYNIFSNINIANNVVEVFVMLKSIANVEIHESDRFSKFLCEDCFNKLIIAYEFKVLCESSYRQFACINEKVELSVESIKLEGNGKNKDKEFELVLDKLRDYKEIDITLKEKIDDSQENVDVITVQKNNFKELTTIPLNVQEKLKNLGILTANAKTEVDMNESKIQFLYQLILGDNQQFVSHVAEDNDSVVIVIDEYSENYAPEHKNASSNYVENKPDIKSIENILENSNNLKPNDEISHIIEGNNSCVILVEEKTSNKDLISGTAKQNPNKNHKNKFSCPVCSRAFNNKFHMIEHSSSHSTNKPFSCTYPNCRKVFRLERLLRSHMAGHANLRKHLCSICGKAYNIPSSLHAHVKMHGEIPRHECTICGQRFHLTSHFNAHVYTHTGKARKYMCENCGRRYRTIEAMRKHISKYCSLGLKPRYRYSKKEKKAMLSQTEEN